MRTKFGMRVASLGMKIVSRNIANSTLRPRKRMRANAYAASTAVTSVPRVDTAAMPRVLANDRAQRVVGNSQACCQFSKCQTVGQRTGGYDCAPAKNLKEGVTIQ